MPCKKHEFKREDHVYVNSKFAELIKDAVRFFHGTPVLPLPLKESFKGAGVYAIYCISKKGLYKTYGEKINRLSYDVPIYVGKAVPSGWRQTMQLIKEPFSDSTLCRKDGHYYLSCDREHPHEAAELWHAPALTGPWTRHSQSANHNQSKRLRRCGGAFQEVGGQLFRLAQDCNGAYGKRLFRVPVERLSPIEYREGTARLFQAGMRHTYNCAETPEGFMEVVDELSYRYVWDVRTVLKALAIPFQLMFRFSRRSRPGRSGWLFQLLGVQFVHGSPVARPALVSFRI